ncbi:unnamed protein product [Coffea canephora]|uniref:Uncharacterized protein n=1 Tax=Coffea canephora TaxID=49390 RepID=A0A068UY61_COFCA|nr:unnamed protein product [Coffea canephora]
MDRDNYELYLHHLARLSNPLADGTIPMPISKSKNGWQQRHLPSAAAAVAIAIADRSFPLPERVQFLCGLHRSGLHCSGINTLGVLGIKDGDADWKSREHHKMELFPP